MWIPSVAPAFARLCAALLLAAASLAPAAEPQLRVVETAPPVPATLGRDQPLYVRIAFSTDEPISIWARPYFQGKQVLRAKSNISYRYTGSGEALGWFSLDGRDEVDEIRIVTGGGKPYAERTVVQYSVQISGTGQVLAAFPPDPPWVAGLKRANEDLARQAREQQRNEPVSAGALLLGPVFMLAVLALAVGGFAAPAWGLWKWRAPWRVAAAFPALLMAFVVGRIVVDTSRDPTSHNLWPFEILIYGAASVAIMAVLALIRRLRKPAS
jgi:hypothetical protein